MNILKIAYLVFVCCGIIAYVITTALAIKRKKAAGETVDIKTVYDELMGHCVEFIENAEKTFKEFSSSGSKTGILKLDWVLNRMREQCEFVNATFDRNYWTEHITHLVELMNYNKSTYATSVHTSEPVKDGISTYVNENPDDEPDEFYPYVGDTIKIPDGSKLTYNRETKTFKVIKEEK